MENVKDNKKKLTAGLLTATLGLGLVGSFAFFSDYVTDNFGGEDGVDVGSNKPVDIVPNDDGKEPDPNNPTNDPTHPKDDTVSETPKDGKTDEEISDRWARLNATALANYNPGDEIALPVQMYNGGTHKIDVRERFVITSSKPLTQADRNNLEFRLKAASTSGTGYEDFTAADVNGAFDAGVDGSVIETEVVDEYTVAYTLDPHAMEPGAEVIRDFYMIFDRNAKNAFQAAEVTVDVLIEAKQSNAVNGNTGNPAEGWTSVATGSLKVGETTFADAVPEREIVNP